MRSIQSNNAKRWGYYSIISALFVFFAFNSFYKIHYSVDAFNTFFAGNQNARWQIQNGRYFYTLVVYAVDRMGLNLVTDHVLWVSLFMATLTFAIIALSYRCIGLLDETSEATELACILCVCLCFVNVFIAEWFQFTEAQLMYMISVLCSVCAVLIFPYKKDENKVVGRYLAAFILLNIAFNSYQVGINFFVFYVVAFIMLADKGKLTGQGVKKTLIAALMVVGAFVINLCMTRLLIEQGVITGNSRMLTLKAENIWANAKVLLSAKLQSLLWLNGNGMMRGPDLLIIGIVLLAAGIYTLVTNKTNKKKWYDVLYTFVLLAGGVFALALPILITDSLWMAPRTIVPFFCIFFYLGCLTIMGRNEFLKKLVAVVLLIALCRQVLFIQAYSSDALISNACDRLWAEQVECRIEAYEQREGIQVTKIGFVPDQSMQWQWGDISYPWDGCLRTISIDYARRYALAYYTGVGYSLADVPDEVKAHFSSLDWDTINLEEQMIFDNEVCYICIF